MNFPVDPEMFGSGETINTGVGIDAIRDLIIEVPPIPTRLTSYVALECSTGSETVPGAPQFAMVPTGEVIALLADDFIDVSVVLSTIGRLPIFGDGDRESIEHVVAMLDTIACGDMGAVVFNEAWKEAASDLSENFHELADTWAEIAKENGINLGFGTPPEDVANGSDGSEGTETEEGSDTSAEEEGAGEPIDGAEQRG